MQSEDPKRLTQKTGPNTPQSLLVPILFHLREYFAMSATQYKTTSIVVMKRLNQQQLLSVAQFAQSEISPGAVLQLEKSWTVISACEEHISQYAKSQGNPHKPPASDATIRLICEQTDGKFKSHIRIYKQIPAAGTEAEPAAVRAKQARICEPDELIALRALTNKGSKFTPRLLDSKSTTQDDSGVVPGGFLVYIVWEVVAGEQLGTQVEDENCAFWRLNPEQRDILRQHFRNNFMFVLLSQLVATLGVGSRLTIFQSALRMGLYASPWRVVSFSLGR
ncbi:hypothetical protein ASPBRDRAFT_654127 [Aspergillus brasiliensis CBS 101740]|uniref:Uncharacterized protein n=1 Tax=Aspergillus brasiliensis (strain CBS 101740 / IMI 381727 / IBT 21946) TaxID=767769 RepID=A0A1L9UZN2_ASPBC|nr:hypothetical protein ASPBRDRAFT_654127 [Aspergillus brasiliensis CBS 101740]